MGKRTTKDKYNEQKSHAKSRGIKWEFTFNTWMKKWDGMLHLRGRKKNQYCMARKGDIGSYSTENTDIILHSQNISDACLGKSFSIERRQQCSASTIGMKNPNVKLTNKQVIQLRDDYSTNKYSKASLSRKYNIGYTQTSRLIKREQRCDI